MAPGLESAVFGATSTAQRGGSRFELGAYNSKVDSQEHVHERGEVNLSSFIFMETCPKLLPQPRTELAAAAHFRLIQNVAAVATRAFFSSLVSPPAIDSRILRTKLE